MQRRGISTEEAFDLLRETSQNLDINLIDSPAPSPPATRNSIFLRTERK